MILAEALLIRSDLQKKIASLQQRINQNMLYQEGESPSEDPKALLEEVLSLNSELYQLIERIHKTNATAKDEEGTPLLTLLNRRESLIAQHRILQQAIDAAHHDRMRYSSTEIRWITAYPVAELQSRADHISQSLRGLNLKIQALNWKIELQ